LVIQDAKLKKLKERKSWTYRYNCGRHCN
jgi:hypothetical protein